LSVGSAGYLAVGGLIFHNMAATGPDNSDLRVLDPYRNTVVILAYLVFAALLVRSVRRGRVAGTLLMPVAFVVSAVLGSLAVLLAYALVGA
jgi:hypothetical protein